MKTLSKVKKYLEANGIVFNSCKVYSNLEELSIYNNENFISKIEIINPEEKNHYELITYRNDATDTINGGYELIETNVLNSQKAIIELLPYVLGIEN